ncbi:Acetyl-coenzyme A synthetase, partial [hydrothermal vent metagenome]
MTDIITYEVPADFAKSSHVDNDKYLALYQQSMDDPEKFWGEMGRRIDWIKPFAQVKDTSFAKDDLHINWYKDG